MYLNRCVALFIMCVFAVQQTYGSNGNLRAGCSVTDTVITVSFCGAGTFYVGTTAYAQTGIYHNTLTNASGCDSIVTLNLTINPLPVVTLSWDSMAYYGYFQLPAYYNGAATLCYNGGYPIDTLRGGTPYPGVYSGFAVNDNMFNAALFTGYAVDTVTYTYTDTNGCHAQAVNYVFVDSCMDAGIPAVTGATAISVYPSPAGNILHISFTDIQPTTIALYDVAGRLLLTQNFVPVIDITPLSAGAYFIVFTGQHTKATARFTKL